jgi:predicted SprT family Zn-dependent metalloprotease
MSRQQHSAHTYQCHCIASSQTNKRHACPNSTTPRLCQSGGCRANIQLQQSDSRCT